ncbi:MAG TPA: hypothetical protein VFU36_18630 [Jatrophihabitans sp.]|nr:hypothetical protein [Jatrophihabitans sp.]
MSDPGRDGISWAQLLTLMVHGPDPEPPVRGAITSYWPPERFGVIPLKGPGSVVAGGGVQTGEDGTGSIRVWRDGDRVRICDSDGALKLIVGAEYCWDFTENDEVPASSPAAAVEYLLSGTGLLVRRGARELAGDDAIRPVSPIEPASFLGRPAWSVTLAAPPARPDPLLLVVDAETGLILQSRSVGWAAWTEFVVGEPPPPDWFEWTGPSRSAAELRADRRAEEVADRRRREKWIAEQRAPLEHESPVWVHSYDPDTGSFHGDIGGRHSGMLARRPADARDDWALGWDRPGHRWRDERWEWALYLYRDDLSPSALADLERQFSSRWPR